MANDLPLAMLAVKGQVATTACVAVSVSVTVKGTLLRSTPPWFRAEALMVTMLPATAGVGVAEMLPTKGGPAGCSTLMLA